MRPYGRLANLACVWKICCKMIMIACTDYDFRSSRARLQIGIEQTFNGGIVHLPFHSCVRVQSRGPLQTSPNRKDGCRICPRALQQGRSAMEDIHTDGYPRDWEQTKG